MRYGLNNVYVLYIYVRAFNVARCHVFNVHTQSQSLELPLLGEMTFRTALKRTFEETGGKILFSCNNIQWTPPIKTFAMAIVHAN